MTDYTVDVVLESETTSILFDAVIMVTTSGTSKVSSHPLESGAQVSDHITKENIGITLQGIVTAIAHKIPKGSVIYKDVKLDTKGQEGLPTTVNATSGTGLSPAEARQRLMEMRESDGFLTITTPTGIFTNMVLVKFTEPRKPEHGGDISSTIASWEVTIDLQQLRVFETGTDTIRVSLDKEDKVSAQDSPADTVQEDSLVRSVIKKTGKGLADIF